MIRTLLDRQEMQTPIEAHRRYLQQSCWTADLRSHLLTRIGLDPSSRLLEVGSGSGVITTALQSCGFVDTTGVDIDLPISRLARRLDRQGRYLVGDGLQLPFVAAAYDAALCHFLLLWVRDPRAVLGEMIRVVRPGGWVLAFAEPDYGGRLDFPEELAPLGAQQTEHLKAQGADPFLGRRLRALFHQSGLETITCGIIGAEWGGGGDQEAIRSEWGVLQHDLGQVLSPQELQQMLILDEAAWLSDRRVLFVPTFYAIGRKPASARS